MIWSRRNLLFGTTVVPAAGCLELKVNEHAAVAPRARASAQLPTVIQRDVEGSPVYVIEDRRRPIIALGVVIRAGFCHERRDETGFAALFAALVEVWAERARYVDFGTNVHISAGPTHITLRCTVRREDGEKVLNLMMENLKNARPEQAAFERARQKLQRKLERMRGSAEDLGALGLILGSHGVAPPVLALASGSQTTIICISRSRFEAWRELHVHPGRFAFAVAGDVDWFSVAGWIPPALRGWSTSSADVSVYTPGRERGPNVVITPLSGSSRTLLAYGGPRSPYGDPREVAEYEADTVVAKLMCSTVQQRDVCDAVSGRTWATRFGPVQQWRLSFAPVNFEWVVGAFMGLLARLSIDSEFCEEIATEHLMSSSASYLMEIETQFAGAEEALKQLLILASHKLPGDAIVSRLKQASEVSVQNVAEALKRCYALLECNVSVVVSAERLQDAAAQLEKYGGEMQTPEQLMGWNELSAAQAGVVMITAVDGPPSE